jgi:PAS domain S-box-containing protein
MSATIDAAADEIRRLNGCINDLTTILALSAIWSGSESSQIVSVLLDALLRTLRLDFAYARLAGGPDASTNEMVRLAQRQGPSLQAGDIGQALDTWLTRDLPVLPLVVPNPVGDGTVTIACFRLGLQDDPGILVVGSTRADFPTKIEMLLMRVALNQAAIGLQESRRLGEQQRAAAEQVAETRIQDYVAEEDRGIFLEHILAHVLREGEWEGETRFRNFKTGAVIPTRQHIFLIREPGTERRVAMAAIVRDITESQRSEEALRAARDQLAHIARVTTMGELAASIAHEVNQPLTAVVTNGDAGLRWLSQSPPNVDEAQKAMKEMVKQGHRASDLISRIRALLRKTKPNISSVDTRELIEEVLTLTRQRVEEHGVTVKVETASDIPPVSGDSVQLQQVLVNLILNALEATGAARNGARELLVTSQCLGANEVVIAVHDSGTGIDPQYLDQLFRPFFTTKGTGLGMGLAISRSIVEAHGGRLWATSKEGQGATFQFSLPIHEAH